MSDACGNTTNRSKAFDPNESDIKLSDDLRPDQIATEAIRLLNEQAALMVHVSTKASQDRNPKYAKQYRTTRLQLRQHLSGLDLDDPIPYEELDSWNGHWALHLSKWELRRAHVRGLTANTLEVLGNIQDSVGVVDAGSDPNEDWQALDTRLSGVLQSLAKAANPDDYQDVGRRCREVLIDAARLLADPSLVPTGEASPKAADGKAWLSLYLNRYHPGGQNEELRQSVVTTWDLAQKVTHSCRTRVPAFTAAQATTSLIRILQTIDSEIQRR